MGFFIYIHICPNGKRYVGTTQRLPKERWDSGHGYRQNKHFTAAIRKYGWANIKHEVFEVSSIEDMHYGEKYLISYYNTTNPNNGYNHSLGGENSAFGCRWHMSEEAKQKLREFQKGNSWALGNKSRTGLSSWNKGLHTPYRGGGSKKGQILKKAKWLTPDGNIVEMGRGQVHRFHPDWQEINN